MKNVGKWLVITIVLFIISSLLWSAKNTFDRVNHFRIETANNLKFDLISEYFVSGSTEFSPSEYYSFKDNFLSVELNKTKIPFGKNSSWYRLSFVSTQREDQNLVILYDNPMLDYIDVYTVQDDELNVWSKLGDKRFSQSFEDISLPSSTFVLQGGETHTFVIRTTSNGTPQMPIAIFAANDFAQYKSVIYIIWGSFIGIVILMAMYNLLLYIGVKDPLYLIYVAYITGFLLVLGVVHGFLLYLVNYPTFDFISDNVIFFFCIVGLAMLTFSLRFLQYDKSGKSKLYGAAKILCYVLVVLACYSLFVVEYQAAQLFFAVQGLIYLLSIVLVAVKLRNNLFWTRYYVVSWAPLFIGAAVGPLMLTGNLEYNFWTRHALLFGVVFEMTFISMALAERLRMSTNTRLYQANHDQFLDIGNTTILRHALSGYYNEQVYQRRQFSLATLSIQNYHQITPYLAKSDVRLVIRTFVKKLEQFINARVAVLNLNEENEIKNVVVLKDGFFSFVILSTDEKLLRIIETDFNQFVPYSFQLEGFNVTFNCQCSCVHGALFNSSDEIIDFSIRSLQNVNQDFNYFTVFNKAKKLEPFHAQLPKKTPELTDLEIKFQPILYNGTKHLFAIKIVLSLEIKHLSVDRPDRIWLAHYFNLSLSEFHQLVFDKICEQICLLKMSETRFVVDFTQLPNLSKSFVSNLVRVLNKYNLKSDRIILKISQNLLTTDFSKKLFLLQELVELGFELIIDEQSYGTANLDWQTVLPIKYLCMDSNVLMTLFNHDLQSDKIEAFKSVFQHLHATLVINDISNHALHQFEELFSDGQVALVLDGWLTLEELRRFLTSAIAGTVSKAELLGHAPQLNDIEAQS